MQTNETRNAVIHYLRSPNVTITEAERYLTGGAGSGVFKPISGQESAPNAFEGARSVILTPDGAHFYQIIGDAAKLVGYASQLDSSLNEITSVSIPYNSPQGLAGV